MEAERREGEWDETDPADPGGGQAGGEEAFGRAVDRAKETLR